MKQNIFYTSNSLSLNIKIVNTYVHYSIVLLYNILKLLLS